MSALVNLYTTIATWGFPAAALILILTKAKDFAYKLQKEKYKSEGVRYYLFGSNGDIETEYTKIGTDNHGEIIQITTNDKTRDFVFDKKMCHRLPKDFHPYGGELVIFYHHTSITPIDVTRVDRSSSPDVLSSIMSTKFMKELTTPEKSLLDDPKTMVVIAILVVGLAIFGVAKWQGWI